MKKRQPKEVQILDPKTNLYIKGARPLPKGTRVRLSKTHPSAKRVGFTEGTIDAISSNDKGFAFYGVKLDSGRQTWANRNEFQLLDYELVLHDPESPFDEKKFTIHSRHRNLTVAEKRMLGLTRPLGERAAIRERIR